ncbi:glycosyltransferase family 2 protein [Qipengyuania sp. 6B39]|uniref:glycosyltransferase family A protein n=1 Tax=Qipengyuania proteolytica TaxID=2867239 RepID=UPI001C8AB64D|nr:glycosyltransferase family A protein [Qipengyuania proteolytica]MBX7495154.1 glycosyltransferase family 2 protein [Qipengyuania proteolytica]
MTPNLPIIVTVLAHNEERRIARCLESLPLDDPAYAVHVVVNGTNDRTAEIADGFADVTVHDWEQGGKARSWNRFMLDTPGIDGRHFVFVDGDAEVVSGSIPALVAALDANPINAATAYPANGRRVEAYREQMAREHGLFGDLYALHGDFVALMRGEGIRLPEDLIGDDGLLCAMAKTDLSNENDWQDARVMPVEAAGFLCDPVSLTPRDLALQARRMRNYSVRHFQNRIISDIMRGAGPKSLPQRLASLYPQYLPGFRPRRDPTIWWFDRQALKAMRRAAG